MFFRDYKIRNFLYQGKISGDNTRHRTSKHIRNKFPDRWKEYTTFIVVRNPWHRYASFLRYKILKDRYRDAALDKMLNAHSQTEFIFDKDKVIVDKILKFENLQQEWDEFSPTIGLYPRKLPYKNNLGIYDYRDFFNDNLIDIIYRKEKKIIDMMGYTYD